MVIPSSFAFRSSHILSSSSRLIKVRIMRTSDIDHEERYHVRGPLSRVDDKPVHSKRPTGANTIKIANRRKEPPLQLHHRRLPAELEHLDVGVHEHPVGLEGAGDLHRRLLPLA